MVLEKEEKNVQEHNEPNHKQHDLFISDISASECSNSTSRHSEYSSSTSRSITLSSSSSKTSEDDDSLYHPSTNSLNSSSSSSSNNIKCKSTVKTINSNELIINISGSCFKTEVFTKLDSNDTSKVLTVFKMTFEK